MWFFQKRAFSNRIDLLSGNFILIIRRADEPDFSNLLDIWLRSVVASHDFLKKSDIKDLVPKIRDVYLSRVELWVAENGSDHAIGFIGLVGMRVDMLFVDPDQRGNGIGGALLDYVLRIRGGLNVDVNEQNTYALGFYLNYGFILRGRSSVDSEGLPHQVLHLTTTG
jgi:putative acetyltransferase